MDAQNVLIGLAAAVLLTLVGLSGLYLTRNHRDTLPFQQCLFVTAMTIRFAAAIALLLPSVYQTVIGSSDATGWEGGRGFKETIEQSELGPLAIPQEMWGAYQGINRGYGTFVGLYFYFTRLDSELSAAAFSCFAGATTAVMAYRLARLIFSEDVAVSTGWLVCFFPSMVIWSIQTIKEPIVILCEVAAIYACTFLRTRHFSPRHILLWLLSILVILPLRFYAAYMLGGVVLVALLIPNMGRGSVPFGSALTGGIILFSVMSMASDSLRTHQETFESFDMDQVQDFRQAVSTGTGSGSGVQSSFEMNTSGGMVLATLVGALHLLLAPFPWQFVGSSLRLLMTAPEMIAWWVLVARGLPKGLTRCIRRQPGDVLPMLLFMLILGSVYSMMFGNIGIIYRQRAQLLPYLFMIIMVGFDASRARRLHISPTEEHFESVTSLARASA
jgi:hypothetical protein